MNSTKLYLLASSSSITNQISDWALEVMDRLGGFGAALLIALENIFPPIPSELILPLAGYSASQGELNFFAAILWTTSGSVVGALILYSLGAVFGRERIRHWANKIPLIKISDIDKAERWFLKHETKAVFFGRMIPIVRSMISIPAGVERMSIPVFIVYTAIGSMIWNTALISAGYLLGDQWKNVEGYVATFKYFIVLLILIGVGYFVISRLKKRKSTAL